MAVSTCMPTGSPGVEKMLGSGLPSGVVLSRLVLVAVEGVDTDRVEGFQVALPHHGEGQPVQPGVVGDEADDAPPGLLRDAPLRHAE